MGRALRRANRVGGTGRPQVAQGTFREQLDRFESLGDACEFAALQRAHAIDRPTLFGWRGTTLPMLSALLETELDSLDDPAQLQLDVHRANPELRAEYMLFHRTLGVHSHTFKLVGDMPPELVLRREHRQLVMLKRKFLEDLRAARRVFVFRTLGPTPEAEAERLCHALRRYGPNELLWVRLADRDRRPGDVDRLRPGLTAGWMDALAPYADGAACPGRQWPTVLNRTLALIKKDRSGVKFAVGAA